MCAVSVSKEKRDGLRGEGRGVFSALRALTLDKLESGTGPPMQQQERDRVRVFRFVINHMQLLVMAEGQLLESCGCDGELG